MITNRLLSITCVVLIGLMIPLQNAQAAVAGQVQFVMGTVKVTTSAGSTRPLIKGETINEGDEVATGIASSAQIKMKDGGFVAIRPDTQMKFDKFIFHGKPDSEERSFFSLLKGGFRAVTGLIGSVNKQNYRITTPAATIGIRGTDHETFVVPVGNALVAAGAYSKVNVGETTLTTNLGTVNVRPNQMGFSGGMNEIPKLAPINTNIFTVSAAPTKTIKESKAEKSDKPDSGEQKAAAKNGKDDKPASQDGKVAQTAADKPADKQDAKQESPAAGSGDTPIASGDSGSIRNVAADNSPSVGTAVPGGAGAAISPLGQSAMPSLAVPQVLAPIVLINEATGTTLNTTTQTQAQGGVTSTLTSGLQLFAAYSPSRVAVQQASSNNSSRGGIVSPADLVYVTGAAGGASSSGALKSYTFNSIVGTNSNASSIVGGAATSTNAASFATTGIQYGAWSGYTSQTYTNAGTLGGKNGGGLNSWMYGPQGYLDTATTLSSAIGGAATGTFNYVMDGGTAPFSQNSGLTGTLTSASLTANFVSMTLSANLALTMPGNENWGASVTNQSFSTVNGGQFGSKATVTYSNGAGGALAACSTCSGSIGGAFTGQNYAGALLSYSLYNGTATSSDVRGHVALTRIGVAGNATVQNGAAVQPTNWIVADWGGNVNLYPVANTTNTNNVLTGYSNGGNSTSVSCTTCTSTASGQAASTGIYYGNWTSGTYTNSWSNTATTAGGGAPSYWITGPEAGPVYLAQALTGTANFAFDSGLASNSQGVAGTVLGTTALTLNFTKQTVGINLDVSIKDTAATPVLHTWNVKTVPGSEARLTGNNGIGSESFYAYAGNAGGGGGGSGLLTVSIDGVVATNANANIGGQLTGVGLTGAIISFSLSGNTSAAAANYEYINGVAAFTAPASNIATAHRYVSVAYYDSTMQTFKLGFDANNASRVIQNAAGNLTQFDSSFVNKGNAGSQTISSNTSALLDHGADPVSGISWGRWAGGTINITDRATGVVTATANTGSLHWITEPVATSAVTLPISGTYTYTHVGGTSPTDNLGNVGTLNSATLAANFTAQTVSVGVNATVNGATLNATAASAPIIQKTVFFASTLEPTTGLKVTCIGACAGAASGEIIGKFTGAGATGAAMTYGLQHGTTVVNGVAAFHR
jgi:hypothetical protein